MVKKRIPAENRKYVALARELTHVEEAWKATASETGYVIEKRKFIKGTHLHLTLVPKKGNKDQNGFVVRTTANGEILDSVPDNVKKAFKKHLEELQQPKKRKSNKNGQDNPVTRDQSKHFSASTGCPKKATPA